MIFKVGDKVQVRSDYVDGLAHRRTVGTVEKHAIEINGDGPALDNWVRFESGDFEPFGNWELKVPSDAFESVADVMATKEGKRLYNEISKAFDRGLKASPKIKAAVESGPTYLGSQAWIESVVFQIMKGN